MVNADKVFFETVERRNTFDVKIDPHQITLVDGSPTNIELNENLAGGYSPLVNSLFIFLIMAGILLVISALLFVIREYTYTVGQLKKKQFEDEDRLDYCWNESKTTANSQNQKEKSYIESYGPHQKRVHHWPRGTFSPTVVDNNVEISTTNYSEDNESSKTKASDQLYDFMTAMESMDKLKNVINVIPTRNATLKRDNLFYYYTGVKGESLFKKRNIYSIDQLINLNNEESNIVQISPNISIDDFDQSETNYGELKKMILKPFFRLHPAKFESLWKAEKEINEITECFIKISDSTSSQDIATKKIMIIRLLTFASNTKKLHNPNIYISKFDSLMEILIDYGIIFDLLNISNTVISQALIDMVLSYIWCHWNFKKGINKKIILKKFEKWKLESPSIRPNNILFRYLLNLELGIYTVGKMDILLSRYSENKIITFLKFASMNSHCNDYVRFVPLIAQAVQFTERIWTQRLFYNILLCIVKKHRDCCIKEYLLDDTNCFKEIVQHGFWIQNDSQVRKTAEHIHMLIIEKYPSTMSWWNDTDGGLKLVNATSQKDGEIKKDKLMSKKNIYLLGNLAGSKGSANMENEVDQRKAESMEKIRIENSLITESKVPGSFNF